MRAFITSFLASVVITTFIFSTITFLAYLMGVL